MKISYFLVLFFSYSLTFCQNESDYEIFIRFKNEIKIIMDYYRNDYIRNKEIDKKKILNEFIGFQDKISMDSTDTTGANNNELIPKIEQGLNSFLDKRESGKKVLSLKVDNFLTTWKTPDKKKIIEKVGKEYDFNYSDQIIIIENIKQDLDFDTYEIYQRTKSFLVQLIQDKNELIALKGNILDLESRFSTMSKDKTSLENRLSEIRKLNEQRAELIQKFINVILKEYKIAKGLDNFVPHNIGSKAFNMINDFYSKSIEFSQSATEKKNPSAILEMFTSQRSITSKFDSLYNDLVDAKIMTTEEKNVLISNSNSFKQEVKKALDEGLKNIFNEKGVSIVFESTENKDWFLNSLRDFIKTSIDQNGNYSNKEFNERNIKIFKEAFNELETKWRAILIESAYMNEDNFKEIEQGITSPEKRTNIIPIILIAGGVLFILILTIYLINRRRK